MTAFAMTHDEFERRMAEVVPLGIEDRHVAADRLMCEVLKELGYGDGVAIFESMGKWYA